MNTDKLIFEMYTALLEGSDENGALDMAREYLASKLSNEDTVEVREVVFADILHAVPNNRKRIINCLKAANIQCVEDLLECTGNDLCRLPEFGRDSLDNLRMALRKFDLKLKGDF